MKKVTSFFSNNLTGLAERLEKRVALLEKRVIILEQKLKGVKK